MNKLIIESFRAWKRRNVPHGMAIEIYHVVDFFSDVCPPDQHCALGTWEIVCDALGQAGEYDHHGDHLSIMDAYCGRPEGRAAWEEWRAIRKAALRPIRSAA